MARTRTPGITIASDGRRFIDKEYRGVRMALSSWRSWTELNPGTLAWVMRRRVHRRCFAIQ